MMVCGDGIVSYKGQIMNQETYEAIRKAEKQKEQEELEKAKFQSFSMVCKKLGQATELLKATLLMAQVEGLKGRYETVDEIEQFLNEDKAETSEEPYYVIMNMNCQYEICRKCPKSRLFKGTYEECENWIKEKLSEVEK